MPLERGLETLLEQESKRHVQPGDERDGGRERGVQLLLRPARPLPIEVVARRRGRPLRLPDRARDRDHREAGRRHQRLLRAGRDDVDPPGVGLEPHGAETRDGVDDHVRARRPDRRRQRPHVRDDPGRGLAMRQEDGLGAAELDQQSREVVRNGCLAPLVAERRHLGAEALGELDPALAEVPGGHDDDPLAGRAQIRDRGLERPGPGSGEEEDVRRGPKNGAQPLEHFLEERAVVGGPVVDHGFRELREHLRRNRSRSGREEIALLGHPPEPSSAGGCRPHL